MLRKRSMGSRACNISASARLSVGKYKRTSPPLISQRDACIDQFAQKFFLRDNRVLDGIHLRFDESVARSDGRSIGSEPQRALEREPRPLASARIYFFARRGEWSRSFHARRGRSLHSCRRGGRCGALRSSGAWPAAAANAGEALLAREARLRGGAGACGRQRRRGSARRARRAQAPREFRFRGQREFPRAAPGARHSPCAAGPFPDAVADRACGADRRRCAAGFERSA